MPDHTPKDDAPSAKLTVDLWTCDVGCAADTPLDYLREITTRVRSSWEDGADLVLFPEYTWMGLERFVKEPEKLPGVPHLFQQLWPQITRELCVGSSDPAPLEKAVVLGSTPVALPNRTYRNRAPILFNTGEVLHQDKINLTPWESTFSGGEGLEIWTVQGCRLAVLICLDVEVPELAVALRSLEVDALLVPSATETTLGMERISRCASARAVELGCYVGVAHLVGQATSELVDENIGRTAWYTPSQHAFRDLPREDTAPVQENGFHRQRVVLDKTLLTRMRKNRVETNPAHLTPSQQHGI